MAKKLTVAELRKIVTDSDELQKGTHIFDSGGLDHLARFETKLYADAKGSGASPYKVQVVLEDDKVKARCNCMAARSRPFCKHSAALLVAWARAPESFAVADAAPAGAGGQAKKKEVKKGKTDAGDLIKQGVEQVATLVRELSVSGVASLASDRVEQIRALATNLREYRLRRLSARTLQLANLLEEAEQRGGELDVAAFADLMADMLLTVRKLEKHVAGEALEDRYVEELIGKTWTKKDRTPISGLTLVEYCFTTRTTADNFIIRESRFLDVKTGTHYSEKQIIPAFLVKSTDPKRSYFGVVLKDCGGSQYPGFSPHRLDIDDKPLTAPLDESAIRALVEFCLPNVGSALKALQDQRKDVFAPDLLPVAVKVDTLVADGARSKVVDASDAAVFLPDDAVIEERLSTVLRSGRLVALLGDLGAEGALPTLTPLAAVVEGRNGLELCSLGGTVENTAQKSTKVRVVQRAASKQPSSAWAQVARSVGVSGAAVSVGEVREELAHAWSTGLASLVPRLTDSLVSRLKDLGLEKQADLLANITAKPDPADRLDDLVKLYQVLGIALIRLCGTAEVDRSALESVPTYQGIFVQKMAETLAPEEVVAKVSAGDLNRYQAAVHYGRYYSGLKPEEIAANVFPMWADGSAGPYIARALADKGSVAVEAARKALQLSKGRVACMTAIRVLEAVGGQEALSVLQNIAKSTRVYTVIKSEAQRALNRIGPATAPVTPTAKRDADVQKLCEALLSAPHKEKRIDALHALENRGAAEAVPFVRMSFVGDISRDVREAAAHTLGLLADADSVDSFVRMLRDRDANPTDAKVAAYALGHLGDVRGLHELLQAFADGWQPSIVAMALGNFGEAALDSMVRFVEAHPEVVRRKAAVNVVGSLPPADVARCINERLDSLPADPAFVERADVLLQLAAAHPETGRLVARKLLLMKPELEKSASKEERALHRKARKAYADA